PAYFNRLQRIADTYAEVSLLSLGADALPPCRVRQLENDGHRVVVVLLERVRVVSRFRQVKVTGQVGYRRLEFCPTLAEGIAAALQEISQARCAWTQSPYACSSAACPTTPTASSLSP